MSIRVARTIRPTAPARSAIPALLLHLTILPNASSAIHRIPTVKSSLTFQGVLSVTKDITTNGRH